MSTDVPLFTQRDKDEAEERGYQRGYREGGERYEFRKHLLWWVAGVLVVASVPGTILGFRWISANDPNPPLPDWRVVDVYGQQCVEVPIDRNGSGSGGIVHEVYCEYLPPQARSAD